MKYILLLISTLSHFAYAENTQILKCRIANAEWNSTVILDAIGAGFLKLKKNGSQQIHTCSLKLDFISDGQRAVVPQITVEFTRGACDPDLGEIGQEVLSKLTLLVNLTNKNKPEGKLQWLRYKQPESCAVDKLSMFDISMNTKKWNEGKWGNRSTASDPKSK